MDFDIIKLVAFTMLVSGICYLVGYIFLVALRAKLTALHYASSPLLGLALLAVQLWVYGLIGVSWSRWTLLLPWLVLSLIIWKRLRKALPQKKNLAAATQTLKSIDLLGKTLLVLCVVFSCAFVVSLALEPVITSDVLAIWGYKAKDFFMHQQVFVSPYLYSNISLARFYHVDYPPLLPLMADVFYVLLGHINDSLFKLLQSLFLLTGATTLFAYLKSSSVVKKEGLQVAAIATFLLVAAPQFFPMLFNVQYMGYADYPLAIFMLISVIFLARFVASTASQDWWLSFGFASFAAVTKNEGLPFLAIMLAALFITRFWRLSKKQIAEEYKSLIIVLFCSLLVILPLLLWTFYKQRHGMVVDFKFSNLKDSGMTVRARLHVIRGYIWLYISTNPAFHWESIALLLATATSLVRRSRTALIIAAIVWAQLGSYVISFVFSPYDLKFHILSSIDRLLTQVLPIVILLIAANLLSADQKKPKQS